MNHEVILKSVLGLKHLERKKELLETVRHCKDSKIYRVLGERTSHASKQKKFFANNLTTVDLIVCPVPHRSDYYAMSADNDLEKYVLLIMPS